MVTGFDISPGVEKDKQESHFWNQASILPLADPPHPPPAHRLIELQGTSEMTEDNSLILR